MKKLALFIDIEGFSSRFDNGGRRSFVNLTNDLFTIGSKLCETEHLSIIQFGGDGFLITEIGCSRNSLLKFIEISVALLQSITLRGGVGRVQISHGYLADIQGLLSGEIRNKLATVGLNNLLADKHNIMLINPLIGTSIINCYKLKLPKGPLLLVDKELKDLMAEDIINKEDDKYPVLKINWVKFKTEKTQAILSELNLSDENLEMTFKNYLENNKVSDDWDKEAKGLLE
jgi:hypothetical protein